MNLDGFITRLETILHYYNLNASTFADKIGVQRSSLSHLLSGRNNPSLDFILKIIEKFPEVDLYWILNGLGTFPKAIITANNDTIYKTNESLSLESPISSKINTKKTYINDLFHQNNTDTHESINLPDNRSINNEKQSKNNDQIYKIVVFYADGTFEEYHSRR